jgi:hypothetical protein
MWFSAQSIRLAKLLQLLTQDDGPPAGAPIPPSVGKKAPAIQRKTSAFSIISQVSAVRDQNLQAFGS